MNDFKEVFLNYGWTVYYFAGLCTGIIISLLVGYISLIGDFFYDLAKDLRLRKKAKNDKS